MFNWLCKKLDAHFFHRCVDLHLDKMMMQRELTKSNKILKNLYQSLDPGYSEVMDFSNSKLPDKLIYKTSVWLMGQNFPIDKDNIGQRKLLASLEKAHDHIYSSKEK